MFGIMRRRSFAHYKILMGEDFSSIYVDIKIPMFKNLWWLSNILKTSTILALRDHYGGRGDVRFSGLWGVSKVWFWKPFTAI